MTRITVIDNDFYCSGMFYNKYEKDCRCDIGKMGGSDFRNCVIGCCARHRKRPTLEQYKKDYGEEISDEMPVWFVHKEDSAEEWNLSKWKYFKDEPKSDNYFIIIACTPFVPDHTWRPQ
jgi:hypothetical protein